MLRDMPRLFLYSVEPREGLCRATGASHLVNMSGSRAHLAESYDEDALPASDAQAGHAQIVQVLAIQLGGAHIPPARLREARHASVLQHLCRARQKASFATGTAAGNPCTWAV